uniref:Uncharacterized protein n=1 Tax=Fagus sylvatica TaxID=28930 RepID=A0A2N9GQF1_FAGSY
MAPSRHHHPDPLDPLLLSIPPLNQPIWSCMGEFCWRLWVARASNRLSLFCWHDLAVPVGIEIFFDGGCLVGIGLGIYSSSSFYQLSYFWVVCLAGIKDLNLLLFWTLVVVVVLEIF